MSKLSVQLVTEKIIQALKRCKIRYRLVHSRMSNSRYLNIYNKVGICIYCIRIASHPVYEKSTFAGNRTANVGIGNFSGAKYGLDAWYLVLDDISGLMQIIEVKRMCARIIAEEKTRRIKQSEEFRRVLENVRKKAVKPKYVPSPELDKDAFLALSEEFAARFGYAIERYSMGDTHFIGFRRYNGERVVWIAVSAFDKYVLPPDTDYNDIISFGSWKTSMYRPHQWDMVLQSVARSFNAMSRQARQNLNRFVSCSREKYQNRQS